MNVKPCIYDSHVSFRTTPEVKDLFLKAQKADKKRLNVALLKVCKFILDNPTKDTDISDNVKKEKEQEQIDEEKEVKPTVVVNAIVINKKSAKEPTKEELNELIKYIQVDGKEDKVVSLREKRNSIRSSSKHPVAFQNREEYFRYLNNVVRPKYNTAIPAEKELYLAEKAEVDKILIVDENSEDEE